jgi:hypothetical protein
MLTKWYTQGKNSEMRLNSRVYSMAKMHISDSHWKWRMDTNNKDTREWSGTYRRQYLWLGNNAVGQTVLSALCSDLSPSHLEASHGLVEIGLGHLPRKVAGYVNILDDEWSRKVLRFGEHFGKTMTWGNAKREIRVKLWDLLYLHFMGRWEQSDLSLSAWAQSIHHPFDIWGHVKSYQFNFVLSASYPWGIILELCFGDEMNHF